MSAVVSFLLMVLAVLVGLAIFAVLAAVLAVISVDEQKAADVRLKDELARLRQAATKAPADDR